MTTDDAESTDRGARSLFERALGDDWTDLHPELRERYGVVAADDRRVVGTGTMAELRRSRLALPVLWLGARDDFVFPEAGTDVPFSITTEAFVDAAGDEALFLAREFDLARPRTFVDTLRWNPDRDCVTDLFGRRGLLAADLHLSVDDGALVLDIGAQWLRVGTRYVPVPGPLGAGGTLRDHYDDAAGEFVVEATIENSLVGPVFGYRGSFENEFRDADPDAETASALGSVPLPGGR